MKFDEVDQLAINTIRTLSIDAIERSRSGHPGAPMGLAPAAYLLFTRFLKHCPTDPGWPDRDRFVLSCGHASMLLYSILHLSGYDLSLDEIKQFRQWGSKTPGHPEHGLTAGVEVTSGPLGQGCATSVGLALAEAHLAARFNRDSHRIVDHTTYVLCSDGDLMEGVSAEAASLAGNLGLGKLVWIWDDNRITIEGSTDLTFTENVEKRFEAYGWHVQRVGDMNDLEALTAAIEQARDQQQQPSFIAVRSHIAFGAPTKQDSASSHGSPLGDEEARGAKRAYGWPEDASFLVPDEVRARFQEVVTRGEAAVKEWQERVAAWQQAEPEAAAEYQRRLAGELPEGWHESLPAFSSEQGALATRAASGQVINAIAGDLPELVGGSADLDPSCKTRIKASDSISAGSYGGRNLHFGIREHGMGSLLNGLSLHGGIRPLGSTFLVFADYMRPPIRLAAMMEQPVIYVFTHDSIWVGEDGPTHQPIEQILALRAIPNLYVVRPADANETAAAWQVAVERKDGPVAILLSRQGLPILDETGKLAEQGLWQGAYMLAAANGTPDLVILASGSEVHLALQARQTLLSEHDLQAAVVSMPCWELFDLQPETYRQSILIPGVPRLAVEAGVECGWRSYVGDDGDVVAINRFGASAPGKTVAEKLGMTADEVARRALALLGRE
jgi:transketolase